MYKEKDQIFVRITKTGYIPQLQMCGPIPNPIKLTTATCLSLVKAGIPVFQVNPDTMETVELDLANVFDDDKFAKVKKTFTPIEEVKVAPQPPVIPLDGVKVATLADDDATKEETPDVVEDVKDEEVKTTTEETPVEDNTQKNTSKKSSKKKNK